MKAIIAIVMLLLLGASSGAETADQVRAAYRGFAEAQNARDADRIRGFMTGGDEFLWVSDGKSFWGIDAVVARMTSFQKAEIWRVEPDLASSSVVELDEGGAMLHMPLTLVIGPAAKPDRLEFLVTILFRQVDGHWRIAALLTTSAKP